MGKHMSRRDKVECLERRLSYLNYRLDNYNPDHSPNSYHFMRAEAASLRWAISLCKADLDLVEAEGEEVHLVSDQREVGVVR